MKKFLVILAALAIAVPAFANPEIPEGYFVGKTLIAAGALDTLSFAATYIQHLPFDMSYTHPYSLVS